MAEDSFQHILRVLNTNVDGKQKIMYALTSIKGLGRRFANLCCKKAEIDMRKRYVGVWGWVTGDQGPCLWVCWAQNSSNHHMHTGGLVLCSSMWRQSMRHSICLHTAHLFTNYPHSAGELSTEELERILVIVSNPRGYKIPDWFLNRQKDIKDGRYSQVTASALDTKLREDLERLKKMRCVVGMVLCAMEKHPQSIMCLCEANYYVHVCTPLIFTVLPPSYRAHRGLRHYWGMRVRGQHTKTTGHRGRTVGVGGKKK